MHRSASRLTRVLACAAVPVILTVAGCSSDSGKDSGSDNGKKSGSSSSSSTKPKAKPSAALEKAAYATLPDPCKTLQEESIETLVPEAKDKSGTATKSNDLASRASCSWNGLDEDGLKGSKYRWLSISLIRYDSHASLGSGNKRATDQYNKQVEAAKTAEGAHDLKADPAGGIGDEGTAVIYGVKKDVEFFNTTLVVRTQNVVVTVDYNAASYEGAEAPDQAKLLENAIAAAKETVASVDAANKQESPKPEQSPSAQ
ncbi:MULTISPECIES: DUF3558 family protein [unclassified Streptomyces]|uniref:DUF3558 family protein n=1 Tax=unclassified Streptomyces TaxID=2593676 RepID=UPI001BEB87E3|nr:MULTISPECIES: DUF3558 family protein [unclassified Streptomyces]MBT2406790.1 DUF3558 domain-containing protein [Streptomyces sp. ISL-21]MBT2456646.1 DUF3558 domain-containing protein [Streptomyces sp. ISL-86]MBT2612202.1 DUF3558 domain-containing protein [Streptomyces sp. ISL-87]